MEIPVCPLSEHVGSGVVRAGWYGREGQRRQRWLCRPLAGQPHRFAETLPRIVDPRAAHACAECATALEPWEGQPAPRLYGFTARDVAFALAEVAAGATYRSTAAAVRRVAGRPLGTQASRTESGRRLPAPNDHGQLVSDWVEVFAPVIWAAYAPATWPDRLLLDECGFRFHKPGRARGEQAFQVLGVVGYRADGKPFVAAVEAVPVVDTTHWTRLLHSLPGQPVRVVTDGGLAGRAAMAVWPGVESHRCEWHLARNLTASLPIPVRADRTDPIHALLANAQRSVAGWNAFAAEVDRRRAASGGYENTLNTVHRLGPIIGAQAADQNGWPRSTGPLEQFLRELDLTLSDRAARLTNKTRTDALLKLLAAKHNRWGTERDWAELVRDHLTGRAGHARYQRLHTDPKDSPSLRVPRATIDDAPPF